MSIFNVSTVWNIDRNPDPARVFEELNGLGFERFELAWLSTEKFKKLKDPAVRRFVSGRVDSLHNFVPDTPVLPKGRWKGNAFMLTALDEEERRLAVKYSLDTINNAAEIGAKAVVIHVGEPLYSRGMSEDLTVLLKQGLRGTGPYNELFNMIKGERAKQIQACYERGLKSLDALNARAVKEKILLGLETRLKYEELPGIAELEDIFSRFEGGSFRYWHDMGHAFCQEQLGFVAEMEYLERFGDRLLGMHVHDVKNTEDHNSPGTGEIDYSKFTEYFKNNSVLKVFEIHHKSSAESIRDGRDMLESLCLAK